MRLVNQLPFAAMVFKHWAVNDEEVACLIVKGSFGVGKDGQLQVADRQEPLALVDEFFGAPHVTSLRRDQEIAPGKPRCDVTLNAVAHSPTGKAATDWPVSVEIPGKAFYGFHVRGPSQWERSWRGWRLGLPEPVATVPIRYELAYGGSYSGIEGEIFHPENPLGRGFVSPDALKRRDPIPAPQIGELAEFMAADIETPMTVHGLSPLGKAWQPRLSHAGTFDDAWRRTRHPRMPADYSLAFWNAAPRRLQLAPYPGGGDRFVLRGLTPGTEPAIVALPNACVFAMRHAADPEPQMLDLTDVAMDLADPDPSQHRVTLIWRATLDHPQELDDIIIGATKVDRT